MLTIGTNRFEINQEEVKAIKRRIGYVANRIELSINSKIHKWGYYRYRYIKASNKDIKTTLTRG